MPNVIGVFDNSSQAHQAIERMINDGIDRAQISLIAREPNHQTRTGVTAEHTGGAATELAVTALTDMGVPEKEAKLYEDQVGQGKILVSVRAENDSDADRVSNIMQVQGAEDVEGGSDEDSIEAAPEYQGARSRDTADARTAGQLDPQNLRTDGTATQSERAVKDGRVRVYGRKTEERSELVAAKRRR